MTELLPSAVLFDMDGLLVDTETLWTLAQEELAVRLGGVLTPEIKTALLGRGADTALAVLFTMLGVPDADPVEAAAFLLGRIVELFREPGALVVLPGALDLLTRLSEAGVPTALVSSSYRVLVDAVLDATGRELFTASVAGDEVARCKPDPEPYLTAAAMLGADPTRCVVLEDSLSGASAGLAAGCQVVLVHPRFTTPEAGSTDADVARIAGSPVAGVVDSLTAVDVPMLAGLAGLDGRRAQPSGEVARSRLIQIESSAVKPRRR